MGIIDKCANKLRSLADEARPLPPPNWRHPNVFHEARKELALQILNLGNVVMDNITIALPPARSFVQEKPIISPSGEVIPFLWPIKQHSKFSLVTISASLEGLVMRLQSILRTLGSWALI